MHKIHPVISVCMLILSGCGADAPSATTEAPGTVRAAAAGIATTAQSRLASDRIPRDKLPDFVETYAGGRYGTAFFGSNEKRKTGTLLYHAAASPADVAAFHQASMRRAGFDIQPPRTRVVRDRNETILDGSAVDGRTLSVVVIEQSPTEATIQMNFTVPVS
ncbi:hypothetical protein [Sphingomonas colocasiae]|uniref:Uncharacterized protein n=1 Tax=Sphingomonas colocasiae TaxID=1848973 RepID=A0ABS7PXX2_9SPHN|nr:hypothetical protein [Sphingomonas colocasiae]MBY8826212.1 hypothetical protein [Sphingomonas colocasiae]